MDLSGTHVWLVLWKSYDALHRQAMMSISSLDMCVTDFGILELLLHKGPHTINAIGDKLSLASASITAAIDRLERRNLLKRTPSKTDRRAKVVELTTEGAELINTAFATHKVHMNSVAEVLTIEERETLLLLLKKLGKHAQNHAPDGFPD